MERLGDSPFSMPNASEQLQSLKGTEKGSITLKAELGQEKGFQVVAKKQLDTLDKVLNTVAKLVSTRNWVELHVPTTGASKPEQIVYVNVNSVAKKMGVAKKEALKRLLQTGSEQRSPGRTSKDEAIEKTRQYALNHKEELLSGGSTEMNVREVAGQEKKFFGLLNKKVAVETPVHTAGKTRSKDSQGRLPRSVLAIGGELYISVKKKGGAGGFKTIYLYEHVDTGEVFALAKLKSVKAADMEDLPKEQTWQTVFHDHPNIAKTHGVVNWTSKKQKGVQRKGILMPYLPGGNLKANMMNLKSYQKLNVAKQLFSALDYMHGNNDLKGNPAAMHNDLKPDNIMLGAKGEVKLIDFGLACEPGSHGGGGTSTYMAPELWAALKETGGTDRAPLDKMDAKVDVWAAGCILHQMLTGKQAPWLAQASTLKAKDVYEGKKSPEPLLEAMRDDMAELAKQWTNPTEIQKLILDCLNVDPKKRISSQEAFDRLSKLKSWD